MFMGNWKKEILTIPNLLSLFRLVLIPVYADIYLNAKSDSDYFLAGSIMTVSCLTDMIDGQIARRFHMVSNLGKFLDPLADKTTQFILTYCLSLKYQPLQPVLALLMIKELFQIIAGLIYLQKGKMLPGALMEGKICTAVLFLSLITLVLFPRLEQRLIHAIAAADTAFLCIAFGGYVIAYLGKNTHMQDLGQEP